MDLFKFERIFNCRVWTSQQIVWAKYAFSELITLNYRQFTFNTTFIRAKHEKLLVKRLVLQRLFENKLNLNRNY